MVFMSMWHLVFAWIKVKVREGRDWNSWNLVGEHLDHIQLQPQNVRKSEQTESVRESTVEPVLSKTSQINDTNLTLLPGACLLLEDLRLLVFLNLVGDLSACLDGDEEAIETLPDSRRGFGRCGEEDSEG